MTVQLAPMIVADPGILGGVPRVEGTRISVHMVLERMSQGWTIEMLLENFPTLTREGVLACLAFATSSVDETNVIFTAA